MLGGGAGWRLLAGLTWAALLLSLSPVPCYALMARCPQEPTGTSDSYCNCGLEKIRSGFHVSIKCNFMKREDVVLTEELYPLWHTVAVSVYVQVKNATSVRVTESFMGAWLWLPAAGLDLWNCGTVSFDSAPLLQKSRIPSFSTSAGIGVVGCEVKELPPRLLRDRATVSLRVKNSVITTIRPGIFHNIHKVQYLVMENTRVGAVEGALSLGSRLGLGATHPGPWNGFILSNVTMNNLAAGAFSFINKGDREGRMAKVEVTGSQITRIGESAFNVAGNIAVTIKNNLFTDMARQAFKINVTSDMKFEENIVVRADPGALENIICNDYTTMERNTVHLNTPPDQDTSILAFHPTCGIPQMFKVVSPSEPLVQEVVSAATWVFLVMLLLVLLAVAVVTLFTWRQNNMRREFTRDEAFHFHNGLTSSPITQAAQQDDTAMQEISGEGVANPLYEDMEYKSSL